MVHPSPIPLILTCPMCRERHVDKGVFAEKPHHTHACQACGFAWRPAVVDTVGVQFLPGFRDEDVAAPAMASPVRGTDPQVEDKVYVVSRWRYFSTIVMAADLGKNLLGIPLPSGVIDTDFPKDGVEVWTQICLTIDGRLRRLEADGLRIVVALNEREILFSEAPSHFVDRVTKSLPRGYDVNYERLAIRLEGPAEIAALGLTGMVFRLGANCLLSR